MKKLSFLLLATWICSGVFLTSCGEKETGDDLSQVVNGFDKLSYSTLSVSEQKEKLQEDANAFLKEMQGLQDNAAIKVLTQFNNLLQISPLSSSDGALLRSTNEVVRLSDDYGTYTWNNSKKDWDFAKSTTALTFNFPVDNSTGKIVYTAVASGVVTTTYTYTEGNDPENGWWYKEDTVDVELPKQITGKIYSGSSEVGSIDATSQIKNANTFPSLTSITYKLGEYSQSFSASKASPNVVISTLKKGNKVLIEATANLSGNLDDMVEGYATTPGNGNAVIKILDKLAFVGTVDKKYWETIEDLDERYYYIEDLNEQYYYIEDLDENHVKDFVKAYNDYIDLFLVSLSDNTKIANLKLKAKSYTLPSSSGYRSYWEEVPVLQFGDGTNVEAEAFFSSGFDSFLEQLGDFIRSFE